MPVNLLADNTAVGRACLYQGQPSTTGATVYTAAASPTADVRVTEVLFANTATTPATVTLNRVPSGGTVGVTNQLLGPVSVGPGATVVYALGTMLGPGDFLSASQGTTSAVTVTISGEVTASDTVMPVDLRTSPTIIRRCLYQGQPGTSPTAVYTSPGNPATVTKLTEIVLTNTTATAATASVSRVPVGGSTGSANRIVAAMSTAATSTVILRLNTILNPGDFVSITQGTAAAVTFTISADVTTGTS